MPRLTATTWIDADPMRVFDICQAPPVPLLPRGGARLVVLDEPGVLGSRYRWEARRFGLHGRFDSVVTESIRGERLAFRSQPGWELEADLTFTPEKDGTRLIFRVQYRFPVPFRWLLPGGLIRLGVWHALRQIKESAEGVPLAVEALTHP